MVVLFGVRMECSDSVNNYNLDRYFVEGTSGNNLPWNHHRLGTRPYRNYRSILEYTLFGPGDRNIHNRSHCLSCTV